MKETNCDSCGKPVASERMGCLRLTDDRGNLVEGAVKDLCPACTLVVGHSLRTSEILTVLNPHSTPIASV